MSEPRRIPLTAWLLGLATLVLVLGSLLVGGSEPGPTSYGTRAEGLLTLYRALEDSGRPVRRFERPLSELPAADGTLVVAAPLATGWSDDDTRALRHWMGQGGRVLLVTSGQEAAPAERALLDAFDLELVDRDADPPLWWPDWRAWRLQTVPVAAREDAQEAGWPATAEVRLPAQAPRLKLGAEPLYADGDGGALISKQRWRPGQLVVVAGSSALDNAGIGHGDNLDLALALVDHGRAVTFDEVHHGHLADPELAASTLVGPLELLAAHLALVYLLAVFALSRRMGPALPPIRDRQGSVARDLEVLARLHRHSGHAAEAGQRLLRLAAERARQRGSHVDLPDDFNGGEAELLALARRIGRLQEEGRV